jgi:hypothetical protein
MSPGTGFVKVSAIFTFPKRPSLRIVAKEPDKEFVDTVPKPEGADTVEKDEKPPAVVSVVDCVMKGRMVFVLESNGPVIVYPVSNPSKAVC